MTQTMLETWERENPDLEWQSCEGAHLIKHGSAVQSTITLICTEYYASLRSSAHALGIKAMLDG